MLYFDTHSWYNRKALIVIHKSPSQTLTVDSEILELIMDNHYQVYFICICRERNITTKINPVTLFALNTRLPEFKVSIDNVQFYNNQEYNREQINLFESILKQNTIREFNLIRLSKLLLMFKT